MFNKLESKVNHTIGTLFFIGLLCVGLGVMTLLDTYFLQFFVGLLFFLLAYVSLHMAYRMQIMRDAFFHVFHLTGASQKEEAPKKKARK